MTANIPIFTKITLSEKLSVPNFMEIQQTVSSLTLSHGWTDRR